MPTGSINSINHIVSMVHQVPHDRILDIGCGYGKYGLLLREYLNEKPITLDALEATKDYVKDFRWLNCIYDNIINVDATLLTEEFYNNYNVVMINDVIEHIEKDKALALLKRIKGYVVIATPSVFFKQSVEGKPFEDHLSFWERKDFEGREEVYYEDKGGIYCRLKPLI
jgi:2-polyprenyl-3-methyl-5-hydroxy-6-metoxy-1,4-benzoquinol methylase